MLKTKFRQNSFGGLIFRYGDGLDSVQRPHDAIFKSEADNPGRDFGGDPFAPKIRANVVANVACVVVLVKRIQAATANQLFDRAVLLTFGLCLLYTSPSPRDRG